MEKYIFPQIRAEANKCTVQKSQRNGTSIVCCIGCFNPSLSHQIVHLFHECGQCQCLGIITVNVCVRLEFGSRSNDHRDRTFLEPSFNDPTTSRFAFESMTSVRPPHQHVWFMAPCVPSFPIVCRVLHLVHGSIGQEIGFFVVFPFPPNDAVRCGCARGPSIIQHTDCNFSNYFIKSLSFRFGYGSNPRHLFGNGFIVHNDFKGSGTKRPDRIIG